MEPRRLTERQQNPASADASYRDQPAFDYDSFALFAWRVGEPEARRRLAEVSGQAHLLLDGPRAGPARGDPPALRAAAAALRDASVLLGLARLAAIARDLEQAAARSGPDGRQRMTQNGGLRPSPTSPPMARTGEKRPIASLAPQNINEA